MTTSGIFCTLGRMPKEPAASSYRDGLIARVKLARESARMTQVEVATALGMDQGKYKQYETRSALPHEHVERFCIITRVSERWLMTGKGQGPVQLHPNPSMTG